jgi:hypothetical protein
MKKTLTKFLVMAALAVSSISAFALQEIPTPLALRATGSTTNGPDMFIRDATGKGAVDVGIIVNSYITALASSPTLLFKVQGKTPQGEYYDIPGATTTAALPVVGTPVVLTVRLGTTVAANAGISYPIPAVFRIVSVVAGTGSVTYSIGVTRTN